MRISRLFFPILIIGAVSCGSENGKVRVEKNAEMLQLQSELNVEKAQLVFKSNLPSGVKANVQIKSDNGLSENFYRLEFNNSSELVLDLKLRTLGFSCGQNKVSVELIQTQFQEKQISRKVGNGFSKFKGDNFKGDDSRRIAIVTSVFDFSPPLKCMNADDSIKALAKMEAERLSRENAKEVKKKCEAICRRSSTGGYRNYENCVFTCKNRL